MIYTLIFIYILSDYFMCTVPSKNNEILHFFCKGILVLLMDKTPLCAYFRCNILLKTNPNGRERVDWALTFLRKIFLLLERV